MGNDIAALISSLEKFPSAAFDAAEAGNCFAYERFTAAVYHLMRTTEYGLVGVAAKIGVPPEKRTRWDKLIQGIQSRIKAIASNSPPGWREEEKKYADLCAWFTAIQKGWRNPVSHVPRFYSEGTAHSMFLATRTLFEHLHKQGFSEEAMPASIEVDDDVVL
ncbi:MAG TPA: hypothetical protein VE263_14890 [Candidatus Angelobacter sp.]|nr:hypothetical protein [Candidatus Angelobacter sp.]